MSRKIFVVGMSVASIAPALIVSSAFISAPAMAKSAPTPQRLGQVSGALYSTRGTYVGTDPDASIRQQLQRDPPGSSGYRF